tara:strand:- start:279 stop:512 length:234 start_codon:yes stop_codon:yes gene_type:complete
MDKSIMSKIGCVGLGKVCPFLTQKLMLGLNLAGIIKQESYNFASPRIKLDNYAQERKNDDAQRKLARPQNSTLKRGI